MVTIDDEIKLLEMCRTDYEKEKVRLLIMWYPSVSEESILELLLERYEIYMFNR